MALEIMDPARKKRLGIICFIPAAAFVAAIVNHLLVFGPVIRNKSMENGIALVTDTAQHFTRISIVYGIAVVITLGVLLFLLVHLARLKNLARDYKFFWAVFLTMFAPFSFIVFWYFKIRREPRELEMYASL